MNRVGAQQARRIIDRLVGYEVSDLLWSKVWRGLSAGRVQTVTLRIIVERETEREAFLAVPYFSVPCTLRKGETAFPARVTVWRGEKLKFDGTDPRLATREAAEEVVAHLSRASLRVVSIEAKERRSSPRPPSRPRSSSRRPRASSLHGPPDDAGGPAALRRKDARREGLGRPHHLHADRLDPDRRGGARRGPRLHRTDLGRSRRDPEVRRFRQKKDAQDAHEAIRPTSVDLPPEAVARYLTADELKLYRLVWTRFVSSQMSPPSPRSRRSRSRPRRSGITTQRGSAPPGRS